MTTTSSSGAGQPVEWRLTALEQSLTGLVEMVGQLAGDLAQLAGHPTLSGGGAAEGSGQGGKAGPSRWCWRHASAEQASWLWDGLRDWVDWASTRYPVAWRDLTPCWPQHGDAVEELTALWAAWQQAYHGGDRPSSDPVHWHDRWLPGVTARLLGPTGILRSCAQARTHRPPQLAGAPRHHFTPAGSVAVGAHR